MRKLLFAITVCAGGCAVAMEEGDPETGAALEISVAQSAGILAFVNDPSTTFTRLDVDCGLYSDSARKIIKHRDGKDKDYPSADDNRFDDLAELDSVPQVGPATMESIAACAQAFGFLGYTVTAGDVAGIATDAAARFGLYDYATQVCEAAAGEAVVCVPRCVDAVTAGGLEFATGVVTGWVGTDYPSRDAVVAAAADAMCESSLCGTGFTVTSETCWADPECLALGSIIGCMES
jgi:hypothetical protein